VKGGKREGAGRPPGSTTRKDPRNVVKQVRWTEAEWKQIEDSARVAGITPSEWVRKTALTGGGSP